MRNNRLSLRGLMTGICIAGVSALAFGLQSPPEKPPAQAPATMPMQPATRPVANATLPVGWTQDQQIAQAIEHGISFLLTQFRNGDIATVPELSDTQRQSLDALCIYALSQAGLAVDDPRLTPRGMLLPAMLARLDSFPMLSDEQNMNRPVTYGRSLRAAALATYDRPEDRATLKSDVAWLIHAEVDGAYTYDDFYSDLATQGVKPISTPLAQRDFNAPNGNGGAGAPRPPMASNQDFGGGSADPGLPYGPPKSPTPPGGLVGPPPVQGQVDVQPLPLPNRSVKMPKLPPMKMEKVHWPKWALRLWYLPQPRSRPNDPVPNVVGPQVPNRGFQPKALGPRSFRPLGEKLPLDLQVEYPWDNSNSQYGLLGVWAGAEVGMEVPDRYWRDVEKHWLETELRTGQWNYRPGEPAGTFAMTTAGVASLLVTHDYLDQPMVKGQVGREPYSRGLAAGLAYLDHADNGVESPNDATHYLGYDLFGIERVGLASGYKYFGLHDWYREMSDRIVQSQHPNGAWGHEDHGIDTLVDTAYSLLFLSGGRHPVLMTKLKFPKFWDNRPRDVANLAKFAGQQLERPLNWQVVGIEHTWDEWFDSPVVYIASHQAPQMIDRDYRELQKFAMAGGLIFTHADISSGNFDHWVEDLAKRIVPGQQLRPIPDTDPIYSILYKLPTRRKLMGVSNGVRWLLVHSPNDLALAWQLRSFKTRTGDFQLGLNVFLYAAGKPDLGTRLDSPFIPEPAQPPTRFTRLARLSFNGNWDPEPAAWGRFSRWLHQGTGEALIIVSTPIEKLTSDIASIATLTGTGSRKFSNPECDALAGYVASGGILLIDPAGGDSAFKLSIRDGLLPQAFSGAKLTSLPKELSLAMKLRPFSADRLKGVVPRIELYSMGKGYLVFSPLDMTNSLLGTNTWGVDGYQSGSTQEFLKNLIHWIGH